MSRKFKLPIQRKRKKIEEKEVKKLDWRGEKGKYYDYGYKEGAKSYLKHNIILMQNQLKYLETGK